MVCPKCQSNAVSVIPAEIRLYRTTSRVLSHPPLTPSPDIQVCIDCGWSEFAIPNSWLAAGWLRPLGPQAVPNSPVSAPVSAPVGAPLLMRAKVAATA